MAAPTYRTYAEAAEYLGVPKSWLEVQVASRMVPHHRFGKYVRFSVDDLAEIEAIYAERPQQISGPRALRSVS